MSDRDLPEPYRKLVDTIRRHAPDMGGEYRAATAELQARLALAQVGLAAKLNWATWAMATLTLALVIVGVMQFFV